MSKEQILDVEQIESDALDDSIVYVWITKGVNGYYFFSSPYATKEKAEQYYPMTGKNYEHALVRIDLEDINFSKRVR